MKEEKRKERCYNCKYSGHQFKIGRLTHLHCQHEEATKKIESAWETLRVFSDTCHLHEFRTKNLTKDI